MPLRPRRACSSQGDQFVYFVLEPVVVLIEQGHVTTLWLPLDDLRGVRPDRPPSARGGHRRYLQSASPGHSIPSVPTSPATSSSAPPNSRGASRMLSPPPTAASSRRASKARTLRTIMDSCSSAVCYACRPQGCLHLGRKYRLEIVTLVVRRSEAAGWRWSSSTMNEWKPSYLGVGHWRGASARASGRVLTPEGCCMRVTCVQTGRGRRQRVERASAPAPSGSLLPGPSPDTSRPRPTPPSPPPPSTPCIGLGP